ncbi:MAG: response regulator [Gammaproteobacteria bacterium]|nr:response regulator [Gammaproteobacteria bacterium]
MNNLSDMSTIRTKSSTEQPQRIHRRLIATFVILLVSAMAIALTSLLWLRVNDMQHRLTEQTEVKANTIATQIAPSLEFGEASQAQALLEHFSTDPSVAAIRITSNSGETFASFGSMQPPASFVGDSDTAFSSGGLWVTAPVTVDSETVGSVMLQASLTEMQDEIKRSLLTSIPIMLVVVLLTVLVMLKAIQVITRPVSSLARTAAEISEKGDYSLRAPKFADDEIGILSDEFNRMLKTIEAQNIELKEQHDHLARSERLESLGLLAGGVAHDLNNILGPLVAMPDIILGKLDENHEARKDIGMISRAARRAAVVIQDLLSLARRGTYKLDAVDLNEIVSECIASPAVQLRLEEATNVRCEQILLKSLKMTKGSEPHLNQLVLNLVINAIEAMSHRESEGVLQISTSNVVLRQDQDAYETIPAGEYTMLSFKDQGPGLSAMALKRIFEPFYTSKKMGSSGSGLGLSVVYGVVHDHGGYLDVISKPGKGAEFRVYLHTENRIEFAEEADSIIELDAKVLVVDDLETQRYLTESLLQSLGYEAVSAASGQEAIKILENDPGIDLMIVDMIMEEGFDGLDTMNAALMINPSLPCIIATGFSETKRVQEALELGASTCLNKPYTVQKLSTAVNRALKENMRRTKFDIETRSMHRDEHTTGMFFQQGYSEHLQEDPVPAAPSRQHAQNVAESTTTPKSNSAADEQLILVVDDDPDIREIAVESISRLGIQVVGASSAAEVLSQLQQSERAPSLLLTDLNMPGGISGLDIAAKVLEVNPHCRVIVMSGQAMPDTSKHAGLKRKPEFLAKPFSLSALNQKIKDVLQMP